MKLKLEKHQRKINEAKSWFLENINEIDKSLIRVIIKNRADRNFQYQK